MSPSGLRPSGVLLVVVLFGARFVCSSSLFCAALFLFCPVSLLLFFLVFVFSLFCCPVRLLLRLLAWCLFAFRCSDRCSFRCSSARLFPRRCRLSARLDLVGCLKSPPVLFVAAVAVPRWCCPLVLPVPCSRLCSCRLCRCLFPVVSSFSLSRCAVRLCLVHLVASLSSVPLVPLVCSSCRRVVRLGSVVHHPSFHPSLRPFLHLLRTSRPASSAARHHPYFIPFTSPGRSPASPLTPSPPDPPQPTHLTQPPSFHPPSPFHRHTSPPHHLRQPPPLRHSLSTSPHPESAAPPPFHRHTSAPPPIPSHPHHHCCDTPPQLPDLSPSPHPRFTVTHRATHPPSIPCPIHRGAARPDPPSMHPPFIRLHTHTDVSYPTKPLHPLKHSSTHISSPHPNSVGRRPASADLPARFYLRMSENRTGHFDVLTSTHSGAKIAPWRTSSCP